MYPFEDIYVDILFSDGRQLTVKPSQQKRSEILCLRTKFPLIGKDVPPALTGADERNRMCSANGLNMTRTRKHAVQAVDSGNAKCPVSKAAVSGRLSIHRSKTIGILF